MTAINMREFSHNMSRYLDKVKRGDRIVLMERNMPVVDIVAHNPHVAQPTWKRPIKRIKIKGEPLSISIVKARQEERS